MRFRSIKRRLKQQFAVVFVQSPHHRRPSSVGCAAEATVYDLLTTADDPEIAVIAGPERLNTPLLRRVSMNRGRLQQGFPERPPLEIDDLDPNYLAPRIALRC